eukprot:15000.XXX_414759_414938_1 [CDS] Oithona nana genome sequencing.
MVSNFILKLLSNSLIIMVVQIITDECECNIIWICFGHFLFSFSTSRQFSFSSCFGHLLG